MNPQKKYAGFLCKERQKEANNERSPLKGYSSKPNYIDIRLNVKHAILLPHFPGNDVRMIAPPFFFFLMHI